MISRIIAAIIVVVVVYICLVFIRPDFADKYGSQSFNENIRMIKRASELDRIQGDTGSLVDKTIDKAQPFFDESKNLVKETKDTIGNVNTMVNEKTEQAKQAAQSAQEAYNKAQEAKNKLNTLTNFGTGK